MPELNNIFTAPLESVQRSRSNVERFPTIGRHLIDDDTPAYAKTEPPDLGAPAPAPAPAKPVVAATDWGLLLECTDMGGLPPDDAELRRLMPTPAELVCCAVAIVALVSALVVALVSAARGWLPPL